MKEAEAVISTETAPSAKEDQKRLGYVPALDGVRGIAVLLVMGNHIPLRRFESLLPGGFAGVDIFFVLSGFLITTLLVQEFQRTGSISLRYFYFRRVLRLGPALLALLLTICALSFVLYDAAHARQNCLNALIALFYASNWVRVLTKNQLGLLAHTWSLSAEEQFYIFWPVILLALLRVSKRRSHIVAVASVIALLSWLAGIYLASRGASQRRLCFGLDSRGDTLMIGCILGVLLSSGLIAQTRTVRKILLVMAPVSLVCLIAYSISGEMSSAAGCFITVLSLSRCSLQP